MTAPETLFECMKEWLLSRTSTDGYLIVMDLEAQISHRASHHSDMLLNDIGDEPEGLQQHVEYWQAIALQHGQLVIATQKQRDSTETHAVLAQGTIEHMLWQLNMQTTKKRQNIHVG
ncbi:hypothetical protein K488DRAFT_75040 [Vararia minispora EC-137]|uniref:Uncharacterized protein n=1 Tax=Vararia minispora EC-137 TaxID=1314806 RepID=A0ACB8Q503_9AGAM|nr:hypothetical protein K488DRAFT_75040 [Vararia minispora EC-137]